VTVFSDRPLNWLVLILYSIFKFFLSPIRNSLLRHLLSFLFLIFDLLFFFCSFLTSTIHFHHWLLFFHCYVEPANAMHSAWVPLRERLAVRLYLADGHERGHSRAPSPPDRRKFGYWSALAADAAWRNDRLPPHHAIRCAARPVEGEQLERRCVVA